jgi:hypothetical protein
MPKAVAGDFGKNEERAAEAAAAHGNVEASSTHHDLALLTLEMCTVLNQVDKTPLHKYRYNEWTRYLKVIGKDRLVRPFCLIP